MKEYKYFAKYITVDGEVTEGVKALKPGFYWGDNKEKYEPPYIEICNAKEFENNYEGFQLVKLFICSNDIPKIGDKVYLQNSYNYVSTVTEIIGGSSRDIVLEKMPERRKNGTLDYREMVKVIGEISDEAIWVQEGDEFKHDDLFANGAGLGWSDDFPGNRKFKIKGPCGHYH